METELGHRELKNVKPNCKHEGTKAGILCGSFLNLEEEFSWLLAYNKCIKRRKPGEKERESPQLIQQ